MNQIYMYSDKNQDIHICNCVLEKLPYLTLHFHVATHHSCPLSLSTHAGWWGLEGKTYLILSINLFGSCGLQCGLNFGASKMASIPDQD